MLLAAVAGCGGSGAGGPAGSADSSTTAGAAVTVGAERNGGSVSLRPGQQLSVVLGSTYWQLSVAPTSGALAVVSTSTAPGGPGCGAAVAGSGCGTATLVARAVHAGSASVVGERSSCGEAMRCGPGQGSYELRVTVAG